MKTEQAETLTLKFPIQLPDRLLAEVTMRRPTVKDLRQHPVKDHSDYDGELRQFAALCGLRTEELELMDAKDYERLQGLYVRLRHVPANGLETSHGQIEKLRWQYEALEGLRYQIKFIEDIVSGCSFIDLSQEGTQGLATILENYGETIKNAIDVISTTCDEIFMAEPAAGGEA